MAKQVSSGVWWEHQPPLLSTPSPSAECHWLMHQPGCSPVSLKASRALWIPVFLQHPAQGEAPNTLTVCTYIAAMWARCQG